MDTHPSAPLLKAISDYDIKLVQRLLYYSSSAHWLLDKDKDWHDPLLITLREETKNRRNRSIEAFEKIWDKDRKRRKGKGKGRQSRA